MRIVTSIAALTAVLQLSACENAPWSDRASAQVAAFDQPAAEAPPEKPAIPAAHRMSIQPLSEIADAIAAGEVTSEAMVAAYLDRIERMDRSGPTLQSVLAVNPDALEDARRADAELAAGERRGPLHGVPVLLKDNIETADNMPTTAGALALKDNYAGRDAPLAAGLREAGAIILGKANLSQWANFRSEESISGWSALGGQVRNPHILDRSPCGSSSGSGAAMAASLAAGTVGTETNGSIICPSSMNGVVGFKPTVGLVSQTGIVPISSTQDTAGPMTLTVRDAALMLDAMAEGEGHGFAAGLSDDALEGLRIGVLRFAEGDRPEVSARFDEALAVLSEAGAVLVDIEEWDEANETFWPDAFKVLKAEFRATLNAYLASTGEGVETRTLAEVIAFNETVADVELALFDQDILEASEAEPDLSDEAYQNALANVLSTTRENGIDQLLAEHDVAVLLAPSTAPAFLVDAVHGDQYPGGVGAGWMAAIAGYPHVSVPMGMARGLPVGLSFMGAKGDDAAVLSAGHAYEIRSERRVPPAFVATARARPEVKKAMSPYKAD
ncbi:MAG: amidase [Pseudomonadota bacterium]